MSNPRGVRAIRLSTRRSGERSDGRGLGWLKKHVLDTLRVRTYGDPGATAFTQHVYGLEMTYDAAGRRIGVTHPAQIASCSTKWLQTYQYDAAVGALSTVTDTRTLSVVALSSPSSRWITALMGHAGEQAHVGTDAPRVDDAHEATLMRSITSPEKHALFLSARGAASGPPRLLSGSGSTSSRPTSRSRGACTSFGTRWRRCCTMSAPISAICRRCSGMRSSRRPRSKPKSRSSGSRKCLRDCRGAAGRANVFPSQYACSRRPHGAEE